MDSNKLYFAIGKTPQEAFENIWEVLSHSDDYCLRKDEVGNYHIRLSITTPTDNEIQQFENVK